MCVPVVCEPVVIGGPVSDPIEPEGKMAKTGKDPVLLGNEEVGKVNVVKVAAGGEPNVIPSTVVAPVG
jgi:hypothetical protein